MPLDASQYLPLHRGGRLDIAFCMQQLGEVVPGIQCSEPGMLRPEEGVGMGDGA